MIDCGVRITYLTQYFRTPTMSGGTRAYQFARRLVAEGHDVTVVSGAPPEDAGPPEAAITDEAGVTVHWLPVHYDNRLGHRQRLLAFGRFAAAATLRARRIPTDLVFATSTPLTIAAPAIRAKRRWQVPMVLEIRDLWPQLPIDFGALRSPTATRAAYALETWAYQHADQIIGLTPGIADSITARFPDTPVHVIPNGTDVDLFADADIAGADLRARERWLGDRPVLLYAGTIGQANGVDYLVDVAAALATKTPEVCVVAVGTGNRIDAVRDKARDVGVLDKNFFLPGPVSKADVVGWFGASAMTASTLAELPSLQGSAPNKVFDSLAASRPVAATYGGWLTDLLVTEGAGLLMDPADPAAAARSIGALLRNPDRLRKAQQAAWRVGELRFRRDDLFKEFHDVLLSAAERPISLLD